MSDPSKAASNHLQAFQHGKGKYRTEIPHLGDYRKILMVERGMRRIFRMAFRLGLNPGRNMKQLLIVGLLAFLVPTAARATSCAVGTTCFGNLDGNATSHGTGASTYLSLSGSEVDQIGGELGHLGKLSFTTGDLTSGNLGLGGSFSGGASSSFVLTGTYGNVHNGVLFTGTFSGPVTWSLTNPGTCGPGAQCIYTLSGPLSGTWNVYGHTATTGATVQIYFMSMGQYTGGNALTDEGGQSYVNIATVPEPGTLALMGTGFVGIGLIARRKLKEKGDLRQASSWL